MCIASSMVLSPCWTSSRSCLICFSFMRVKIADSFYIIKVAGRREAAAAPFAAVYTRIERSLRQKEIQSAYKIWLARLKRDAFVKIIPPESL